MSLVLYTNLGNLLEERPQTCLVWIPLSTDLRYIYLDEGENVQIVYQYIDEITVEAMPEHNNTNSNVPEKKYRKNCWKVSDGKTSK